nr:histone deacetylase 9-like [Tanacetum cinerariifolium]
MEWSEATNRLMEKVEDDGELIEDVPRANRRIILSTQLMQQVLPSPPTTVLSRDSTLSYESVTFYAARLALGNACNLVSSHSGSNLLSDKSGES